MKEEVIPELIDDMHWLSVSLHLAHVGNWTWDIAEDKVRWSTELYLIYGLDKSSFDASFSGYLERVHPDDTQRVKNTIEEALEKKEQVTFEERIIRPDGEIRYLRSWAYIELTEDNYPERMYGACIDITEAKKHEIESKKKETELKLIFERISDAFVALDKNWAYTYVNTKAAEIFGRKAEDLVGKNFWTEFPEEIDHPLYKAYQRAMETQKHEYIQAFHPSTGIWFEHRIYPSPDGLTIYLADITEKKKAEEDSIRYQTKLEEDVKQRTTELEQRNAIVNEQKNKIEDIIKELHHRVKNNLQIITSLLRLQSEKVEDKETKEIFNDCQNRIYSMSLIHEKMYQAENLTKINTKDYFPELIREIIKSSNINKEIDLDIKVDAAELPTKMMVPLGLLVNEIVLNSMKHAFNKVEKGGITFHLKEEPNHRFKINIGDNGSGFNADAAHKKNNLGIGLINSFVEQLEGAVSRTNDKGTQYEISFGLTDQK